MEPVLIRSLGNEIPPPDTACTLAVRSLMLHNFVFEGGHYGKASRLRAIAFVTRKAVKSRPRDLVKQHHPDMGGDRRSRISR